MPLKTAYYWVLNITSQHFLLVSLEVVFRMLPVFPCDSSTGCDNGGGLY